MEPKQSTPSVIERLMCLDDFLPPQPICKPGRVLSEDYLRKSASIGLLGKRSYHERGPAQINHEKAQEFINGFEVPKRPMTHSQQHLQSIRGGKAKSSTTKMNMSYVRPKFTDAKHLSMDEKLWHSKQFGKQFGQPHSQSSHITVLKSSNAPHRRKSEIFGKSERATARRNILRFRQKLGNVFIADSCSKLGMEYTHQLLKSQLELKDEICPPPSRIVVLKPNIGKAKNAAGPFYSRISEEDSQPCDRKQVEFSKLKSGELHFQVRERKNLPKHWEHSSHSFGVSGEFAKDISGQIPHSISISLPELSRTEVRVSEISTKESELLMPYSSVFDWRNRVQSTYPPLSGSSLAKQTNKRMSGRRKMTKRLQEVGLASWDTSPSKTLAMPDQETICENLNYKLDTSGLNNQLNPDNRDAHLGSPLCFSSGDGWKDDFAKIISRSESPFASCVTTEIPKSSTRNKAIGNNCYMKLQESVSQRNSETMKQNCSQNDTSEVRVPSLSNEKAQTLRYMDSGNNFTVLEPCVILDEQESKIEKKQLSGESFVNCNLSCSSIPCSDLVCDQTLEETMVMENSCKENDLSGNSEENSLFHNSSVSIVASSSLDIEAVAVAETDNVGISLGTPEEHLSEAVACMMFVKDGVGHCSHVLDASDGLVSSNKSHEEALVPSSCLGIDPEFPLSLDEGHYPSPNSVMEPPFSEEFISGSGCVQRLGADLHGLRNQLQLLKSESEETNSEGLGMAASSDEDSGDGPVVLSEENGKLAGLFTAEQNRDFSYLVGVLDEGGFSSKQLGFETWHSLDCPLNSSVFEMLEKKYGEQISWEKSERRLLFDRINSGLKEILQPCMDVLTWAKPLRKRFSLSQCREVIEEELWVLLHSQEKEASKDLSEKALEKHIQSFELREDIDSIVCEIESFLFDELAAELSEH